MKVSLTPCRIGSCTIKNRFVMTAANLGWCEGGYVNDRVTAFYRERAKGGVGLIIAGAAGIDPVRVNQVGMMQIYDDCFIEPMKKLTGAVHQEEGRIFLQLMHAGAYARSSEHNGAKALAPSSYFSRFSGEETLEASLQDIEEIICWFGKAAKRAKTAGFDGVEIIGSAGYLIAEFLSGKTNLREDEYGGDIRSRTRLLLRVIRRIKKDAGSDYPVIVRLSGTDFIPGGNGPEDFLTVGKMIEKEVDAINVTGGWHESQVPQITYHVPKGEYLYLAKALKDKVEVPVIGCNRLDAVSADQAVDNGMCDLAGILRGLIAEPDLVNKFAKNHMSSIRPCLACNQDCLERIFSGKDLACVVNPFAGFELEDRQPALKGKNILVIGAGIAGMVYAKLMAKDNRVVIREKAGGYGGAGKAVAGIPDRSDVKNYLDYLYYACCSAGVTFEWFKEVTVKDLELELIMEDYDRIVICCGARIDPDGLPHTSDAEVITAEECILTRKPRGKRITVIGSGYKAVQTVQFLMACNEEKDKIDFLNSYAPEYAAFARKVYEAGKNEVTLLAEGDRIGGGFGKSLRWLMLANLKKTDVRIIKEAEIEIITKDRVIYSTGQGRQELPGDLTVIAQGWKAPAYYQELLKEYPDRIAVLGDAKRPGRISEAVRAAYLEAFGFSLLKCL